MGGINATFSATDVAILRTLVTRTNNTKSGRGNSPALTDLMRKLEALSGNEEVYGD